MFSLGSEIKCQERLVYLIYLRVGKYFMADIWVRGEIELSIAISCCFVYVFFIFLIIVFGNLINWVMGNSVFLFVFHFFLPSASYAQLPQDLTYRATT